MSGQKPGFRTIANYLRDELTVPGAFPPGTVIRTEHELAHDFGVNRSTIERALGVLKAEGLLVARRSAGTMVPHRPVQVTVAMAMSAALDPRRELSTLGPWETALRAHGLTGHGRVHQVCQEWAPPPLVEKLKVEPGAPVVARYRNPTIDGIGVAQIQRAWMPLALVKGTPLAEPGDVLGGVYACMVAHGITPAAFSDEVGARPGTNAELAVFDRPAGHWVQEIWRVTVDDVGQPVEALHIVADPMLVKFSYQQSLG
jgi:Transcriptional regulators